ncbi:MAG: MarR family transcriptional regulator, partial [Anaerolineales bacterium]
QQLHTWLDELIPQYCPVAQSLNLSYHWSIWQAEFSTDLVFRRQATEQAFYPFLLETLITTVKPADVACMVQKSYPMPDA